MSEPTEKELERLKEIRQYFPVGDPLSWFVEALLQIDVEELNERDFQAHETAEKWLDDWLLAFHANIFFMTEEQAEFVCEEAQEIIKHLGYLRKSLAHERGRQNEEDDIEFRFRKKYDQVYYDLIELKGQDPPESEPEPTQPEEEPVQPEEEDDDEDNNDNEPGPGPDDYEPTSEPTSYEPTVSNSSTDSGSGCLKLVGLFILGLIIILPRYCNTPKNVVSPPRVIQPKIEPPPKVIEAKPVEQTFEEIVIKVKKPKVPGLVLNGKTYNIGDIVHGRYSCKYEVVKTAKPLKKFNRRHKLEAPILQALKKKILRRYRQPTIKDCEGYDDNLKRDLCCPASSFKQNLPKKQKKEAQAHETKNITKIADGVYLIETPGLQLGTVVYPKNSLVVDPYGCSYKIVRINGPKDRPDPTLGLDTSIYQAYQKGYIEKFPTLQCPHDMRSK